MIDVSTRWRPFATKVKGQQVTMEIRPLKNWAYMLLLPLMVGGPVRAKEESMEEFVARLTEAEKADLNRGALEIQKYGKSVFPEHVRNLTGVTIDGAVPTAEQLSEEMAFLPLVNAVCGALLAITELGDLPEKNCAAPSASPQSGSGSAPISTDGQPGGGSICSPPATSGGPMAAPPAPKEKSACAPDSTPGEIFPR